MTEVIQTETAKQGNSSCATVTEVCTTTGDRVAVYNTRTGEVLHVCVNKRADSESYYVRLPKSWLNDEVLVTDETENAIDVFGKVIRDGNES